MKIIEFVHANSPVKTRDLVTLFSYFPPGRIERTKPDSEDGVTGAAGNPARGIVRHEMVVVN